MGGSFDPVHSEHVALVCAAIKELNLDKVIIMPSYVAPHKAGGAHVSGENRLEMCKIAFRGIAQAEICDYELSQARTSYTYLTCAWFAREYPKAERFFLVGADMLENFFSWRNPEEILSSVTLAACGRGERLPDGLHERFQKRFGCQFSEVNFTGNEVSSTEIRVGIAFGKKPQELDQNVYQYILEKKLYAPPAVLPALALESESRKAHSYRVALMACRRAKRLGLPEEKVLLAAALHDCGKYVPLHSPLLGGFVPPAGVPAPVMHQYVGAYLAEHIFGVKDEEVINAIRYHTSGRRGMTALEKLVYLADLLEDGRSYPGVEALRKLFWEDLDACLVRSLKEQIEYLKSTAKPIFALTEEAFLWISELQNEKK